MTEKQRATEWELLKLLNNDENTQLLGKLREIKKALKARRKRENGLTRCSV